MKITADFTRITGKMKPMHGIGQPPMFGPLESDLMHYIEEAGIPCSRLHDVQGYMGGNLYVDIPNIFRDFDADENNPESYDFTFTDAFLAVLIKRKCQPFYRLGVTIENYRQMKAYRIFPPKDFAKWARICEHIIRHYNEGWANGFHYGIVYWEIWNEPSDDACYPGGDSAMWKGTPQQYYDLYVTAAKHLKQCFGDTIKVGGYASCGVPYFEIHDPDLKGLDHEPQNQAEGCFQFLHGFLGYVRDQKAPLDFFSWHSYATNPVERITIESDYVRRILTKYGFEKTEDILNEWNTASGVKGCPRSSTYAASHAFAMLVQMQRTRTAMLNYYDARCSAARYSGMFNPDTREPYPLYFGFKMFNDAYQLKNEIFTEAEDINVPVCGAADGKKKILLIANFGKTTVEAELDIRGADRESAEIYMLNQVYRYTPTGIRLNNGKFVIPPETCVSIRFE